MTPIEKVRRAVQRAAEAIEDNRLFEADEVGPDLREALSLLEGRVLVPREATEEMVKAGTERALNASISSATGGWPAYIAGQWSAMVQAAEEGE